jgi:hypothetical protein
MDRSSIAHLENFLEDVPFPIDRDGLVQESMDSPLPANVREAIALLPDKEYASRKELYDELLDVPFDDGTPKKSEDSMEMDEVDDKMDSLVNLEEFTQMGDEENHEDV